MVSNVKRKARGSKPTPSRRSRWFLSAQVTLLFVVVLNQYRGVPLALLVLGATARS